MILSRRFIIQLVGAILACLVVGTVSENNVNKNHPNLMNKQQTEEMMKQMANKDPQMRAAMDAQMKEFAQMTPEQIQTRVKNAMKTLSNTDAMLDELIANKELMLSNMKKSGMVPPELIRKYENDPQFLEQEIRATFGKGGTNPFFSNTTPE